jgi:hypothetical protein
MRITRESLLKIAQDTAAQRVRVNRRLICIYLSGSLVSAPASSQSPAALSIENPLLGGTTDIDLIFIHDSEPAAPREVLRLSDEVHLDIAHYSQSLFRQPRHLRLEPWLGSFICTKPVVLHDTSHWFDFTQASIFSQFYAPQNVILRARPLQEKARQLWFDLSNGPGFAQPEALVTYFKALETASNAIALLTGEPLTERRFLLHFPARAQHLQKPELSAQLIGLFFKQDLTTDQWKNWLKEWGEAYQAASAQGDRPLRLHACRMGYYQRAAESLWGDHPAAAAWLLQRTWSQAARCLPAESPLLENWRAACNVLNLGAEHLEERLNQLDVYLDLVEETLDQWEKANGL